MLFATTTAVALLAGCNELPYNEQVHQKCANVPVDQKQACEDAEYQRLYEIERYRNRPIGDRG